VQLKSLVNCLRFSVDIINLLFHSNSGMQVRRTIISVKASQQLVSWAV
jgi:hypothetical protein